jgi:hypothetical protein
MSRQARKDETRRIELTLDELEGVSGGKDSLVGKVTAVPVAPSKGARRGRRFHFTTRSP